MLATVARRSTFLALLFAGALAVPASAATRYAAPDGGGSACTQSAPCSIGDAVGSAAAHDEVVVLPGDYALSSNLSPTVPLDIHGLAGYYRPRLIGSSGMLGAVVSTKLGGTISHLFVSSANGSQALELQGGTGDDLVLVAAAADGAKLVGSPAGTVLRDTVSSTLKSGAYGVTIKDGATNASGPVDLRNVTAIASSGAAGVFSQMTAATATLRNVIARGRDADIDGSRNVHVNVGTSDFRPELSPVVSGIAPNTSGDPLFADPANGDFHLRAGSAAIDAGAVDPLVGAVDADGFARISGSAPDMGAYEFGSTGTLLGGAPVNAGVAPAGSSSAAGGTEADLDGPVLPGSPPKAGKSVNVVTASGKVRVKLPGKAAFATLGEAESIPVGATVDAREGAVVLASARGAEGATQNAVLSGGAFRVRQDKGTALATALVLAGGDFRGCAPQALAKSAYRASAVASAARRKPGSHVVRQLWARDKGGRFRTDGRYASALVRGTVWLTQDRCDGTLVRVAQGKVVVHDAGRHRDVLVTAGHSYLTRAHR